MALQSGVPIKVLCDKFVHVRFEPSGYTNHPEIRIAKSVMDYIFRWLGLKFLGPEYGKTGGGGGGRTDPDRARAEAAVPGVVEGGSTGKSGPSSIIVTPRVGCAAEAMMLSIYATRRSRSFPARLETGRIEVAGAMLESDGESNRLPDSRPRSSR